MNNKFLVHLLSFLTVLTLTATAQLSLGTVSSTYFDMPSINNQRYTFTTKTTGDANSMIYVRYAKSAGVTYTIELFSGGVLFATTSAYMTNPLPYLFPAWNIPQVTGSTIDMGDGTLLTSINLYGLRAGTYVASVYHHAGYYREAPYRLGFTFPGSSTGTGSTGTGSTGGTNSGYTVTLKEYSNGLDFTSPVAGRTYNAIPDGRVTIETTDLTKVIGVLFRLDSQNRLSAILNWDDGAFDPYTDNAEYQAAHQQVAYVDNSDTQVSFPVTARNPLPGTYMFLAMGRTGTTLVATAQTWFKIAADTTGGTTGSGTTGSGGSTTTSAPVAGIYDGAMGPTDYEAAYAQLTLKVNRAGRFSGKFVLFGDTVPLKGTLRDGETFSQLAPYRPIMLTPHFAEGYIQAEYHIGDTLVSGRIEIARYHARSNPAPFTGRTTLADTEFQSLNDQPYPAGASRSILKTTKGGRFTLVGKLGSGEPFSAGGIVHPGDATADTFTFVLQTRKHHDMLIGDGGRVSRDATTGGLAGEVWVHWSREEDANAREYADGFWAYGHLESGH